jgi:hypothetical protein
VLEKMDAEGFRRDEKVLVQAKPLAPLSEEVSERPTLPVVAVGDGLEYSKQRVVAFALHVEDEGTARELTDGEKDDVFAGG